MTYYQMVEVFKLSFQVYRLCCEGILDYKVGLDRVLDETAGGHEARPHVIWVSLQQRRRLDGQRLCKAHWYALNQSPRLRAHQPTQLTRMKPRSDLSSLAWSSQPSSPSCSVSSSDARLFLPQKLPSPSMSSPSFPPSSSPIISSRSVLPDATLQPVPYSPTAKTSPNLV